MPAPNTTTDDIVGLLSKPFPWFDMNISRRQSNTEINLYHYQYSYANKNIRTESGMIEQTFAKSFKVVK